MSLRIGRRSEILVNRQAFNRRMKMKAEFEAARVGGSIRGRLRAPEERFPLGQVEAGTDAVWRLAGLDKVGKIRR